MDNGPLSLLPLGELYTLVFNAHLAAPPAFAGSHAIFPMDDGQLLSYDLRTGTREWSVEAHPQFEPAHSQSLIFLVEPGHLSARRQSDGALVWELPWAEELTVSPVWDNEWLVLVTKAGAVVAFRATDGTMIWQHEVTKPLPIRPALAADRVYLAADENHIVALRVDTGEPVWTRRLGGAPTSILALDDQVFAGATDNYFYCLIANTGQVDWRWRSGADPVGSPAVDSHNVYFVALDNVLRALERGHGVQQWMRLLPLRPTRGPLISGSTIIVTGIAATVRAYNVKDGLPAGDLPTPGEITADPYVITDTPNRLPVLVIVSRDIVKGTIVTALARQIEPKVAPIAVLANPVPLPPLTKDDKRDH